MALAGLQWLAVPKQALQTVLRSGQATMKIEQPLTILGQVYQPGGVLLMSTGEQGAAHVMPVAWHTHMLDHPEQIACILRRDSKALQGLERDRSCVLNLPTEAQLATVMQRGGLSSLHADRTEDQPWMLEPAQRVPVSAVSDSLAHIECELLQSEIIGGFALCMLQPVSLRTANDWRHDAGEVAGSRGRVQLRALDLAASSGLLESGGCPLHRVSSD